MPEHDLALRHTDKPIGNLGDHVEHAELANSLITGLGTFAWWMYNKDELANRPQGYRLASWVEPENIEEAYVLLLSRPEPTTNTQFGGYNFTAKFFNVNTFEHTVVQNPTILVSQPDKSPEDSIAEIVSSFTPHEVVVAINILLKIQSAIMHEDYESDADPLVVRELISHPKHLDLLSEQFPVPSN